MSFLDQSRWRQWAREWNFAHSPQKAWNYPNEWLVGRRENRLVRIGWEGDKGQRLVVVVRYPKAEDAAGIRERLRQDPALAGLPGWKKLKPGSTGRTPAAGGAQLLPAGADFAGPRFSLVNLGVAELVVGERELVWSHVFSWRRPKPEQVRAWTEQLIAAAARVTSAFDDRCEDCGTTRVNAFVLFEGLPALLCPGCRQRIADEANMAARGYDQEEANYLVGFACGLAAAVAGGCAWWLIALGSGRIFALLALGIGVFVAWAYRQGARKLDLTGQVGGAVLTVAGVLLGEVLFYASQIAQAQPEVGFRLDAGLWGLGRMLQVAPAEVLFSLLFGAIGAWAAVKMLRRPRFAPRIETPEEAVAAKRRAA